MGDRTGIVWTDATWGPVTGCTRVSEGCDHCYIERTPPFRMAHRRFDGDGPGSSTGLLLHPKRLDQPLRWQRPRRIFVNSMSDLFHRQIPDDYVARVFAVMAAAERHTFQVLTKRPGRMRTLLASASFHRTVEGAARGLQPALRQHRPHRQPHHRNRRRNQASPCPDRLAADAGADPRTPPATRHDPAGRRRPTRTRPAQRRTAATPTDSAAAIVTSLSKSGSRSSGRGARDD